MKNQVKINLILFSILTFLLFQSCNNDTEFIFADASKVWWLAPTIIANQNNIYTDNKLELKTFDVTTGLASLNAVLSGTADIGMVAATPLAMAAYTKENIVILGSFVEADNLIAILTNDTSDIKSPITIVKGTISEFYFIKYMKKKYGQDFKIENYNYLYKKPETAANSLTTNDANCAVIWEPYITKYLGENKNINIIRERNIYTLKLYLVTRPEILEKKKEQVVKFVKSIKMACELIENDKDKYRTDLSKFFNEEIPKEIWDNVSFKYADNSQYEAMKSNIYDDILLIEELKLKTEKHLEKTDLDYMFNYNFNLN